MSEVTDCKVSAAPKKRRASPEERDPVPPKSRKDSDPVPPNSRKDSDPAPPNSRKDSDPAPPNSRKDSDPAPPNSRKDSDPVPPNSRKDSDPAPPNSRKDGEQAQETAENGKNSESDCKDTEGSVSKESAREDRGSESASTAQTVSPDPQNDQNCDKPETSGAQEQQEDKSPTPLHQLESAARAAAEALASLTGRHRDEEDNLTGRHGDEEAACSSDRDKHVKLLSKSKLRVNSKTQAAAADSSTSMHSSAKEDEDEEREAEEEEDSVSGSSSSQSSSFVSENEENDDGECAIVSVKMAPEMRQSVTLLAQVQMKLEALEKRSAKLHQRVDVKISRLRRPHLDQRSSIAKTIPGFWVTALLNHPHLSAHIDETDEDALSYMTDLEIETFKNNKLGYRIRFHFRRNPYFQNNIIMKELHLGMGGPPMSYSNPILWHRGHNLTTHSEPKKTGRGVYQTFFNWFSDHGNPAQDDVAQILKDDLFRDPLRYYLTPLWEPRENGSSTSGTRAAGNGKDDGSECVVISDSDDEAGAEGSEAEEDQSSRGGDEREEEEEEEEEEGEDDDDEGEEEEGMNPGADESPAEEEDDAGEIVIDGSDETDQDDS
ncbi:testis specific protein Y-linked isoform X2 [Periophthalmus magnuspinnatus]|uniref:testis specific protein Y-linked isoform X2 n=1 Tax=Periophthalmus magnuspinnatus TaxID=409849 RepID=UPI002436D11D|nr:testis specific protein Y-linked isoform X2 [Periophthalmus magnuspinnatus]